ncbi:Poly(rC)-binding protein 3 [Characodon lateralis]|uniref:Poly(RC)-binding protein 3 n=1 Tax=Characodon lateralis TaxID=208331 RepID=A0ABU7D8E0_9TELE|nr:Poly(rC)-binding protein 3 [Characodon lateralis]
MGNLQHGLKMLCKSVKIKFSPLRFASCIHSPPKGATIPYRPKAASTPVIFSGGQAYTIQGQYAIPHPDQLTKLHQLAMQQTPFTPLGQTTPAFPGLDASPPASTHELTIPNDVSIKAKAFKYLQMHFCLSVVKKRIC